LGTHWSFGGKDDTTHILPSGEHLFERRDLVAFVREKNFIAQHANAWRRGAKIDYDIRTAAETI
jgi:hypothetical protein